MKLFYSKMKISELASESQLWVTLCDPMDYGLRCPWNSPGQNTGLGKLFPSPGDLPNPKTEPRSPTLAILYPHWHYIKRSSKLEDHLKEGGLDFPPKDQHLYSNWCRIIFSWYHFKSLLFYFIQKLLPSCKGKATIWVQFSLILCCLLLLLPSIFPSIRVFSIESDLRIRWPKY